MKLPDNSVLRIDAQRADPALEEVCAGGTTTKLEPRRMRLLACLAAHAGQVVSVEQLLNEVWHVVVVNPDSVYQAIAMLRRVLGDDAKAPTYIANVLRRGYRLVAPVAPWIDTPTVPQTDSPATTSTVSTDPIADKSIAVLPFVNISGDKSNEYFSDGLSEELIKLLTQIPDLRRRGQPSRTPLPRISARSQLFHLRRPARKRMRQRIRRSDSIRSCHSAISLEPRNSEAHRLLAYIAITRGRFDQAIELLNRAIAIDPLQPWNYVVTGFATYGSGRLAAAEAAYRKALDLAPSDGKVHYLLGSVLLVRGQSTAALWEMEQETDLGYRHAGRALALDALGRRSDADRELAVAEQTFAHERSYCIALIYAARNDSDRAFAWLDRALRQHDDGMLWMTGDPLISNIASDPRYKALLRKMNLPQ